MQLYLFFKIMSEGSFYKNSLNENLAMKLSINNFEIQTLCRNFCRKKIVYHLTNISNAYYFDEIHNYSVKLQKKYHIYVMLVFKSG